MIHALLKKKNDPIALERKLETISMKMTKSSIIQYAQVAKEGMGAGSGTLPANHGHTSHDYNVSTHIIWMKNL